MSYTLTREDFSKIHNAKIAIKDVRNKLEEVLHPDLIKQFNRAVNDLVGGLANIYSQETDERDRHHRLYDDTATKHGFKSIWSIYSVSDFTGVPFPNARRVDYRNHWGKNPIVIEGEGTLTWLDLWRMADKAIAQSGDNHHLFIEEFSVYRNDPTTLILETGS